MKRILIFSTAYFPYVGGAEVVIKAITDRLGDQYECTLICARYNPSLPSFERIGAVDVYRVGVGIRIIDKLLAPFFAASKARSLQKKQRYDLYFPVMVSYISLGAYLLHDNVPIVLTLQEGDPPQYIRTKWFGLLGASWRFALRHSTKVTVISTYLGKLAQEFGYPMMPTLVPNGVDVTQFTPKDHALRKEVVLVTTSRLVEKNACDDVIRALPLLSPHIIFHIYGIGPDEAKLRRLADELGVTERVVFKGQAAHESLPSVLQEADIFIRPSRSEGFGVSFIEAMAAGLPVIATQEGGISDFLYDAHKNPDKPTTGWAVSVNAPKEIAIAVNKILSDKEQTNTVTANARKLVEERYDWKVIVPQMEAVFDAAIRTVN